MIFIINGCSEFLYFCSTFVYIDDDNDDDYVDVVGCNSEGDFFLISFVS